MALIVQWTSEAENRLDAIIAYLEEHWTEKEIRSFFLKLEKGIETISLRPLQQKKSLRRENAYEFQISSHTTLFYSFDEEKVTILTLWPNKMNPKKNKK